MSIHGEEEKRGNIAYLQKHNFQPVVSTEISIEIPADLVPLGIDV